MPFSLDDLIESMGATANHGLQNEFVGGEMASLKVMDREQVAKLFPGETLSTDGSVAYIPVRMCNSYPKINKRGRFFMPEVLRRSCETARDSLVNYDHYLKHNGEEKDICFGHIKAAVFDPEGLLAREVANLKPHQLPTISAPMMALTALYLRHSLVPGIIKEHLSGKSWMTSMECEHQWKDAAFLYEGELVPIADAPSGMRECVKPKMVKPFKDKPLALGLGGTEGKLGFWGLGYTKEPADEDSDILAILAASAEVANKRTFLPLRCELFSLGANNPEAREVANAAVDTRLSELSNIAVLGKTSTHEDGHAHDILTDGTILPAQGHLHSVQNWTLVKGTTPRFTGRTDVHHQYPEQTVGESPVVVGNPVVHMHTFDIPLRGKSSSAEAANLGEDDLEVLGVDTMKLSELQASLKAIEKKLSTGNSGGSTPDAATANVGLAQEIASLREGIGRLTEAEAIQEAVGKEIANQLEAGTLVKKEDAATAVTTAVTAEKTRLEAEFAAKQRQADIKAKRLEAVNALGIDLQSKPYGDEEKDVTVQSKLEAIPLDDTGEQLFKLELRFLKTALELHAKTEEAAKTEVERKAEADRLKAEADAAEAAKLTGAGASAANSGKRRVLIGAPSNTPPATPLTKPGAGAETANKVKAGKHIFST